MQYVKTEKNTVASMYRYWPPHIHNQILHTYGFHVLIKKKKKKKTNREKEKRRIKFLLHEMKPA